MAPEGDLPPSSHRLRTGRHSRSGQIYLVTFTTAARHRYFLDDELARVACRAIADARLWTVSRLLAWVLMPDHWHGLVELGDEDGLSRRIQALKANSARAVHRAGLQDSKVWAPGFHDRALRTEDDLEDMARYLVLNPVRAGLVARVMEYSYWDAVWIKVLPSQPGSFAEEHRD
jgi:REP element-mobilizing transposase RayT